MPRVYIEPPTANDRDRFLEAVHTSRTLHAPWVTPPSTADAFDEYVTRISRNDHAAFLLRMCATDTIAGVINVTNIIRGASCSAFLGFYAMEPFAGKGYMKDGLRLVLADSFERLQLHRLEANIQPTNRTSIALVQTCGFRKEGFSQKYLKIGDEWRDHERWALLAEEFQPY